jgi:translation elongation factor EF-G
VHVSSPLVDFRETIVMSEDEKDESSADQALFELALQRCRDRALVRDQRNSNNAVTSTTDDSSAVATTNADEEEEESEATLLERDRTMVPNTLAHVGTTANGCSLICIRALPLPERIVQWLESHTKQLRAFVNSKQVQVRAKKHGMDVTSEAEDEAKHTHQDEVGNIVASSINGDDSGNDSDTGDIDDSGVNDGDDSVSSDDATNKKTHTDLREELYSLCVEEFGSHAGFEAEDALRIWSIGPKRCGPNILLNRVKSLHVHSPFSVHRTNHQDQPEQEVDSKQISAHSDKHLSRMIENSIINGFQLSTNAGPLCAEPMMGVCFVVEHLEVNRWNSAWGKDTYGPASGQVISMVRNTCEHAFKAQSPRLMEAMYSVELQCTAETMGKLYGVLNKRRTVNITEEMKEGTPYFVVAAHMPVASSFGFSKEVLKKTSGIASPQLIFSHWQLLAQDPFWAPKTQEELEDIGDMDPSTVPNLARDIIHKVRKRKGLAVREKVVEHAEKQRTLSRKK